jgi:hypothetical protein
VAEATTVPGSAPIQLYKNNTDNKDASYGSLRELPDAARQCRLRRPGLLLLVTVGGSASS